MLKLVWYNKTQYNDHVDGSRGMTYLHRAAISRQEIKVIPLAGSKINEDRRLFLFVSETMLGYIEQINTKHKFY